jgi:hypothetical protein
VIYIIALAIVLSILSGFNIISFPEKNQIIILINMNERMRNMDAKTESLTQEVLNNKVQRAIVEERLHNLADQFYDISKEKLECKANFASFKDQCSSQNDYLRTQNIQFQSALNQSPDGTLILTTDQLNLNNVPLLRNDLPMPESVQLNHDTELVKLKNVYDGIKNLNTPSSKTTEVPPKDPVDNKKKFDINNERIFFR